MSNKINNEVQSIFGCDNVKKIKSTTRSKLGGARGGAGLPC